MADGPDNFLDAVISGECHVISAEYARQELNEAINAIAYEYRAPATFNPAIDKNHQRETHLDQYCRARSFPFGGA